MKNIVVVGAGLSGAVIARLFAEKGFSVKVVEKRDTIAGNTYDYIDENGIRIQKYGPHIFHTNNKQVFEFLSQYTEWEKYEHRVLGNINGKLVPVPFNLTSLKETHSKEDAEKIEEILLKEIGFGKKVPILQLKQHTEPLIREFAEFVYQNVFYTYTKKQWGFKPEELGSEVMNRVPVYVSTEDRYFTDEFQYQPTDGFTTMVQNILNHPNISVELGVDALQHVTFEQNKIAYDNDTNIDLIFTGRLDELLNYAFEPLPYRSLNFVFETHNTNSYQPAAVVNYTTSEDFTRISEFTKFCCKPTDKTVIVKEYSKQCEEGDIPYYPIPKQEYQSQYEKYLNEANKFDNLYLLGRLANYKYINMDIAVDLAIKLFEKIINN